MLNAFLSGKKRGSGAEGESLLTSFAGAEDTLTATVFERLAYLPDDVVIDVLLAKEIWQKNLDCGNKIINVQYWPRWKFGDGQVEPDCVFEFENLVLVIEAKRFDFAGQQSARQLASEWLAAREQYAARKNKQLCLLAVGGLPDSRRKTIESLHRDVIDLVRTDANPSIAEELRFGAVSWFNLFKMAEQRCMKYSALGMHISRVIDDIRAGVLLHGVGVSPPAWLADLIGSAWKENRLASDGSLSVFFKAPNPDLEQSRPISASPEIFLGSVKP